MDFESPLLHLLENIHRPFWQDLDEVFALSDRIAVLYEGQIMGVVDPADATREQLGLMMAGIRPESGAT